MPFQTGVGKRLVIAKETTPGTAAASGASDAELLRNVTSTLSLQKQTYESEEKRADYQIADFRHGVRSHAGELRTELSPGSHEVPMQAVLRRDFTTGATFTASTDNVTTQNASQLVRAGGSWITDGFRVGDVVRLANLPDAANNGVNLRIVTLTATIMTFAETITNNATPDADATVTVVGKKSFVPLTSHTSNAYTIEHNHQDIDVSYLFLGSYFTGMRMQLPATGLARVTYPVVGLDANAVTGSSAPHFSAPAAAPTTNNIAAVDGTLRIGGSDLAILTSLEINLDVPWTSEPVIGSNIYPAYFPGRSRVTGQFSALLQDETFFNAFKNETEVEIHAFLDIPGGNPNDFISLVMTRCKYNGAQENDSEGPLLQNIPFVALLQGANSAGKEQTTISIQDSTLS